MSYPCAIDDDDGGEQEREAMIDAEQVRCDCGHVCHYTEADTEAVLCGNCRDDIRSEAIAEHYPQWLAERKYDREAAECRSPFA